jgi:predicted lipoprotein with Yx(FWY)xxD motif
MRGFWAAALVSGLVLVGLATATAAGWRRGTPTVLVVHHSSWGQQLVVKENGQRLTLYVFSQDRGKSTCYGDCQKVWRPLIAYGRTVAADPRVKARQLGTTKRRDGLLQVTYYGQPLYLCEKNKRTGQNDGADSYRFGGSWALMGVAGNPLPFPDY